MMNARKKIVVFGGTGLIGGKTVALLRGAGHHVIAASPNTGVDTITGAGVVEALTGADAVVDVTNSASFEAAAVRRFFEVSGRNIVAAETLAKVRHHVALSIVGTDRMPDNAYFQAKVLQEDVVRASATPYSIVRATQFYEFLPAIADLGTTDGVLRVAGGLFQPIAADDVAAVLAETVQAEPQGGIIEIAGPVRAPFDDFMRRYLQLAGDGRQVVRDPEARYFGGRVTEFSLVPPSNPRQGRIGLETWIERQRTTH